MAREFFFNGTRIGMYEPIAGAVHSAAGSAGAGPTPTERWVSSLLCGALGATVANPLEVLKVRMQVQGGATGFQHPYEGVVSAVGSLVRDEGFAGCVRGLGVSIVRGILGPGSQLFAYGEMKTFMVQSGALATAFSTHVVCALGSAAVSVAVFNPIDVVRTRLYNAPEGWYKSGVDVALVALRTEGPFAFYKGATAGYLRLGPHMVLVFGILEQLKQIF